MARRKRVMVDGVAIHRTKSRSYRSWQCMVHRCNSPSSGAYKWYGERGVTVCDRWLDFDNFHADMGEAPAGKTIDRIDNSRGYEPGNCQWSTNAEQQKNRTNSILVTFGGKEMCIAEAARLVGMPHRKVHLRLWRGWSVEDALTNKDFRPCAHRKV